MPPLVSIITPTYNHSDCIDVCIESVLAQTYQDWEQIIIDDGSTDRTAELIHRYKDQRIRYYHQENAGIEALAHTYNRALALARGELIAILEGDDFWPADKLSMLVDAFADGGIVLAYGEAADVDALGRKQKRLSHTARVRQTLPRSILLNHPVGAATRHMICVQGRSLVSPSTVLIRRSALDQIGGFQYVPGLPLTDYPTFIKISLLGRFYYTPQIMGFRRRHQSSITANHAGTIYEKVGQFTLQFLAEHQHTFSITQPEREAMMRNWEASLDKLHFFQARHLLLQEMWIEARQRFRLASQSKSRLVRFASCVGLLFSYLHQNIEPLLALGGRATFGD